MKQPEATSAESIIPPKKQFLTPDTLEEIWDTRGLKYRVDELHQLLLDRGLGVYVDRPMFRGLLHDILAASLVEGDARRDPRKVPRQRFPRVY